MERLNAGRERKSVLEGRLLHGFKQNKWHHAHDLPRESVVVCLAQKKSLTSTETWLKIILQRQVLYACNEWQQKIITCRSTASTSILPMPRAVWPIVWKRDVNTKPEVHNLLYCRQTRTEPWPQCTRIDNFVKFRHVVFTARDVIYTSRVYATMSVSVCLSVCLWRLCMVVTGCNGSRISVHAWIDRCLCYLLTTPHPDRRMGWCRDFWWKRGYGNIGNCSNITYFTYWEYVPETRDSSADIFIIVRAEEFSLVISVENTLYLNNGFVLELPTSRAMLTTARPSCWDIRTSGQTYVQICRHAGRNISHPCRCTSSKVMNTR